MHTSTLIKRFFWYKNIFISRIKNNFCYYIKYLSRISISNLTNRNRNSTNRIFIRSNTIIRVTHSIVNPPSKILFSCYRISKISLTLRYTKNFFTKNFNIFSKIILTSRRYNNTCSFINIKQCSIRKLRHSNITIKISLLFKT